MQYLADPYLKLYFDTSVINICCLIIKIVISIMCMQIWP